MATAKKIVTYGELPAILFEAAHAWASMLEARLESPRVYWVILSEAVPHLHIHLYPRWPGDSHRGIALFEARESSSQPGWDMESKKALDEWVKRFNVHLL